MLWIFTCKIPQHPPRIPWGPRVLVKNHWHPHASGFLHSCKEPLASPCQWFFYIRVKTTGIPMPVVFYILVKNHSMGMPVVFYTRTGVWEPRASDRARGPGDSNFTNTFVFPRAQCGFASRVAAPSLPRLRRRKSM